MIYSIGSIGDDVFHWLPMIFKNFPSKPNEKQNYFIGIQKGIFMMSARELLIPISATRAWCCLRNFAVSKREIVCVCVVFVCVPISAARACCCLRSFAIVVRSSAPFCEPLYTYILWVTERENFDLFFSLSLVISSTRSNVVIVVGRRCSSWLALCHCWNVWAHCMHPSCLVGQIPFQPDTIERYILHIQTGRRTCIHTSLYKVTCHAPNHLQRSLVEANRPLGCTTSKYD